MTAVVAIAVVVVVMEGQVDAPTGFVEGSLLCLHKTTLVDYK